MYVIKRIEDGKYVAKLGSEHSYTNKLEHAATWKTRETAQLDACGNERVVAVSDILGR